jgi:hypothetical protein
VDLLLHRAMLIGTVTAIALRFPEALGWSRLRRPGEALPTFEGAHRFLRALLRVGFSFDLLLLAHALLRSVPSAALVYPIVLIRLAALIVGDRDLRRELPSSRGMDLFVRALVGANVFEMVILSVVALQFHGVVPS